VARDFDGFPSCGGAGRPRLLRGRKPDQCRCAPEDRTNGGRFGFPRLGRILRLRSDKFLPGAIGRAARSHPNAWANFNAWATHTHASAANTWPQPNSVSTAINSAADNYTNTADTHIYTCAAIAHPTVHGHASASVAHTYDPTISAAHSHASSPDTHAGAANAHTHTSGTNRYTYHTTISIGISKKSGKK